MRNGKLGGTDGMDQVDIDHGVPAARRRVFAGGRSGWKPEAAPVLKMRGILCQIIKRARVSALVQHVTYQFIDPGTWTDDVDFTKFPFCNLKHPLQLDPVCDIGLLEYDPRWASRALIDEYLSLWAQAEVSDQNIAAIFN